MGTRPAVVRRLCCGVLLGLLAGCGQALPPFMHPTYPAATYFAGTPLLALAQPVEADDPAELARRLRAAPADARRAVGREGMTLVLYALMNRRHACLQTLLENGLDPNQSTRLGTSQMQVQPVGAAAGGADTALLTLLLDHGGDPNSRFNDRPATFAAADADRYDHLRLLLDRGADINATDNENATLMKRMANLNNFEQVVYLIKRGGDVHKADRFGGTVAFITQIKNVSPTLDAYKWQQEVKRLLEARGVKFPVPHPGLAFQAKVREENAQRRRWETTTPAGRWFREQMAAAEAARERADAEIYAAGGTLPAAAARSVAATTRSEQLRAEAEPRCQAWRKTQPDWFRSTNDAGMYPILPTPAQEAAEIAEEQAPPAPPVLPPRGY